MKRLSSAALAILATVLVSCSRTQLPEEDSIQQTAEETSGQYVPGVVNVKLSEDLTAIIEEDLKNGEIMTRSSELNAMAGELGIISMERLFPDAGIYEARHRAAGLHRWYKILYDRSTTVTKATDGLSSVPGIDIVEPVQRIRSTVTFNDPYLSQQWHYYNDGRLTERHLAGADINVAPVWENYTVGNSNVIVAVVDGGIDFSHEDLADNCIPEESWNFVDNSRNIIPHDHGTHVAGTIAAINNNGTGVCGIAGGDAQANIGGVRLISCQIFKTNPDDPTKDLGADGAPAIVWGADHGAVISQNSWGYSYEDPQDVLLDNINNHPSMKAAIDYFIENAGCDVNGEQRPDSPMKGGVVIFAAGNEEMANAVPADYDRVIAVGAMAPDFTRAYYSNYGDWVDLAAPGGSAYYTLGQIYSTIPDNGYGWMQGTSMACPHVSGVAALLVSYFGGTGFTNDMLISKLLDGADYSAVSPNLKIGPLLDAMGSFTVGGTTPPEAVEAFTVSARSNTLTFSWKVTEDPDDQKAYAYVLLASKDRSLLEDIDLTNIPENVSYTEIRVGQLQSGASISGTLEGLEFDTGYYVTLAGCDYNRNFSGLAPIQEVTTGANNAPTINTRYSGDFSVDFKETLTVTYIVSDPDGHAVNVTLDPGSAAASGSMGRPGFYDLTINGSKAAAGEYRAVLTVTDEYGASTEKAVDYQINGNEPPMVQESIQDIRMFMSDSREINLEEHFTDSDIQNGDQLSFRASVSENGIVSVSVAGNILSITPLRSGLCIVTVTASDTVGNTCRLSFKVSVSNITSEDGANVYPNPVSDYLNITIGKDASASVRISSSTGKTVLERAFPEAGPFSPISIDMRDFAPGRYTLEITYDGKTISRTIVKL